MAGKKISLKEVAVEPVKDFVNIESDTSESKKAKKNNKNTVSEKSKVDATSKSSKNKKPKTSDSKNTSDIKKDAKLVNKIEKQSKDKSKIVSEVKVEDKSDTTKIEGSKPTRKMPMRDANGRFISAAKAAELEAEAKKAKEAEEKAVKARKKAEEKAAKAAEKHKKTVKAAAEKHEKAAKKATEKCDKATKKADEAKETKKATKKATKKPDPKAIEAKEKMEKAMKSASEAKKDESKTAKKAEDTTKKAKKAAMAEKFNGMDLLISFDTTGSMYPVLTQVRREVVNFVKEMQNSVENLRIGIIAHGDYCDKDNPYTIRIMDFTTDIDKISEFVTETKATYGGDADECYELVLNAAHHVLDWRKDVNRVMVMIGDANPHAPHYPQNKNHLDWNIEAAILRDSNIKVFAVHALSYYRSSSKHFYEHVAEVTGGTYLTLDQFSEVTGLILATCCSQYSLEKLDEFIEIIRTNGRMTNSMARNINRLYGKEIIEGVFDDYVGHKTTRKPSAASKGRHTDGTLVQKDGLVPIAPGRFQTIPVDSDCAIKQFVLDNGLTFKTGRGFYELSKSEKVQQYKEVIIQNRETGEMYNGAQVREYLGLQPQIAAGGVTERLNSKHANEFRVFVQSTSVNRKLIGGTVMLYEISDI